MTIGLGWCGLAGGGATEGALLADPSSLPLREAAPDTELLALQQGELEAFHPHLAGSADRLRLAGRGTALGEEKVGVGALAVGLFLPAEVVGGEKVDELSVRAGVGPTDPVASRPLCSDSSFRYPR